ncbi:MAG: RNA-protein complex protein Nop10 [Candidatus Thermoplasmatota archaeon]
MLFSDMNHIRFCKQCGEYSMDDICSNCKGKTISKKPPRYSPQDNYGKYRRKLKKQNIKK